MKLHRTVITPKTLADLVVRLPDTFLNTETEITAVANEVSVKNYTWNEAAQFYKKNAVDFAGIAKWNREELYE